MSDDTYVPPQDLHEYLKHLVEAVSISPGNESMLRNPQVVLDAALTAGDEDPTPAVEKVGCRCSGSVISMYPDLIHRFQDSRDE